METPNKNDAEKPGAVQTAPGIAIACGGTGGHFYPGLAIAHALHQRGARPVLFIAGRHQHTQLAEARKQGLNAVSVRAAPLPENRLAYPWFAISLAQNILQTAFLLRRYRIHAALVMGSFAGIPLGLAAKLTGRPLFLHEGNAVPGKANRLLSRWARILLLSFPLNPPFQTRARQERTGMPVRRELREAAQQPLTEDEYHKKLAQYNLAPDLPVVLFFGGSQGAAAINRLVSELVRQLQSPPNFQLIHLTGQPDNQERINACKQAGIPALIQERSNEMQNLYRLASLVVCRSGASTLTELALFNLPCICIPFPQATDQHQTANARNAVETGGGELLPEDQASGTILAERICQLLTDPTGLKERGRLLHPLYISNAAARVANLILAEIGTAPTATVPPPAQTE